MSEYQIGIDLGGTKIEALLLGEDHKELYRNRIPTPRSDGEDNYEAILEAVKYMIMETAALVPAAGHYTVGIGIPGALNNDTQLVHNANTRSLTGRPFKADIENIIGRKTAVENDANCFTLAEGMFGAAMGYGVVFGVIMGTGCGGGICINGKIHSGLNGIAGEWGHMSVDPQGHDCFCGNRGCVETKISGSGVEKSFEMKYGQCMEMEKIVNGYRSGDPRCKDIFLRFIDDFGRCLGGLVSMLDPDAVVLGGGLSNIGELYSLGVEKLKHYTFHQNIITPVLRNRLGDSAGVYGAAWVGKAA